jgi:hypothetical protein
MRGTWIEKEADDCATDITSKTRFYSTDGTTCRYYISSRIFPQFHCIGAYALGFTGYICNTNFYLLFYPNFTHVLALSQFLSVRPLYS